MTHIAGTRARQLLLLGEAVDDYVGADNPVRVSPAPAMTIGLNPLSSTTKSVEIGVVSSVAE
jgi:hypothetical protein